MEEKKIEEDDGLPEDTWTIEFSDLEVEKEIGKGQFGSVMIGNYLGTPVASKLLFSILLIGGK